MLYNDLTEDEGNKEYYSVALVKQQVRYSENLTPFSAEPGWSACTDLFKN